MSVFHVGQKVVCIKRDNWKLAEDGSAPPDFSFPVFGLVYTVSLIVPADVRDGLGDGLILAELDPIDCWSARWFKPAVIPKQSLEHDVAEFKRIATHLPAPEKESAE